MTLGAEIGVSLQAAPPYLPNCRLPLPWDYFRVPRNTRIEGLVRIMIRFRSYQWIEGILRLVGSIYRDIACPCTGRLRSGDDKRHRRLSLFLQCRPRTADAQ